MIRVCTAADLRPLEWDGLFTDHREIFERVHGEQLAGRQVMLVADVGGVPLGQVWIDVHGGQPRGAGVIWALRVHPSLQGRGLGTRLLAAAQDVIRAHGLGSAEIAAETNNPGARRLYESLGFGATHMATEAYSYTTPDGEHREHSMELVHLRKRLGDPALVTELEDERDHLAAVV